MTSQIIQQQPLRNLNTFGFDATARYFIAAKTVEDIQVALQFIQQKSLPLLILGEGSNLILAADVQGLVLKLAIGGIELCDESADRVTLRVAAGENWHSFVQWCLQRGYFGLENLSLIPGSVGAAPVQNIGAYGVELKDVFGGLQAIDRHTGECLSLDRKACQFGYRESIFKGAERGRYIITHVDFQLSKRAQLNTRYGAIEAELARMGVEANPQRVSEAVCALRRSKLPDPSELGNAGSFFKNPVIANAQFNDLKTQFQNIVAYADKSGYTKLAAGWLIDQCGWKGFRQGAVGVHVQQALVLVNYGGGRAEELLALAARIQQSVQQRFGVELEMEPSIYPAP